MKKYILTLLVLFLTGCNYTELNNISIIKTMSIDYTNEFKLSVKVLNDNDKIYSASGKTISSALDTIKNNTNKELYLKHLEEVLIVEGLANKGINDIVEYFINNQLISKDFYLYITKKDITKSFKDPQDINKINFNEYLNNSKTYPYINLIPYIENNNITKLSILKKDKQVYFLKNIELYNLIVNKESEIYNIKCDTEKYNSYFVDDIKISNLTHIDLKLKLIENNCNLSKQYTRDYMKKEISKIINEYDILGITKKRYLDKNIKDDYDDIDKNIGISVYYG